MKEIGHAGRYRTFSYWVVRESLCVKVAFDGQEGRVQVSIWRKNIPGRGISTFKGPEMIICLTCSRDELVNQCDIK